MQLGGAAAHRARKFIHVHRAATDGALIHGIGRSVLLGLMWPLAVVEGEVAGQAVRQSDVRDIGAPDLVWPDRLGTALAFKQGAGLFQDFLLPLPNLDWMNPVFLADPGRSR